MDKIILTILTSFLFIFSPLLALAHGNIIKHEHPHGHTMFAEGGINFMGLGWIFIVSILILIITGLYTLLTNNKSIN